MTLACRRFELHSFAQVMVGVLCVLGHKRKDLGEWKDVRGHIKHEMVNEMRALDPAKKSKKRPWRASRAATRGLSEAEILAKGSRPTLFMYEWLDHARYLHETAVQLRKQEAEEHAADEEADDDGQPTGAAADA